MSFPDAGAIRDMLRLGVRYIPKQKQTSEKANNFRPIQQICINLTPVSEAFLTAGLGIFVSKSRKLQCQSRRGHQIM